MHISPLRGWIAHPDATAAEKALAVAVALNFFALPLGTATQTIASGLAAAIWLFSGLALKKRGLYKANYWWPVWALIVLPWVGMLYTQDTSGLGLDYAEKTYYWLFGLSVAAVAFNYFSSSRLIQAFMLGLGLNVLAALAQIVFQIENKNNWYLGLGSDYSAISAYLIVGIMMSIFFLSREHRLRMQTIYAVSAGMYFLHLVILQSRASYVAFVLLVPVMGFTLFRTHRLIKTVAVCLLIPGLMMLSPVVRQRVQLSVEQLNYHRTTEDQAAWGKSYSTQQDRFYMWNGAWTIIKAHPLIGVGTGGYKTVLKALDPDPAAPTISHPHNNLLYMAVSYGILGVSVFVWLLVVTLRNGWRHRHTAEGYMLLSVILVMVTSGLFNTQIIDVGTALLISLSVGLQASFYREAS